MQPPVHLYQIAYSEASLAAVEAGYEVLDNRNNPRQDWYEYGAIRAHLLNAPLNDASFYGFFSPKFGSKTGLSHTQVVAFVQAAAAKADVCLFSPQPDMAAFFLNVFEQGETFDAGFLDAFGAFLTAIGHSANPHALVMDSRQTVFSNYFVARPAFWRAWLSLTEQFYALCEDPIDSPLRQQLNAATSYPGDAQRKVFIMERIASYLLFTQPQWRAVAANPFEFCWSASKLGEQKNEAIISDALKLAFRDLGYPEYLTAFGSVRRGLKRQIAGRPADMQKTQ